MSVKHRWFVLSAREVRSYTWCDQRFASVNIAAPEPARKIVILHVTFNFFIFFIFFTVLWKWIAFLSICIALNQLKVSC